MMICKSAISHERSTRTMEPLQKPFIERSRSEDALVVVGANGAGKTTMIKILDEPDRGDFGNG